MPIKAAISDSNSKNMSKHSNNNNSNKSTGALVDLVVLREGDEDSNNNDEIKTIEQSANLNVRPEYGLGFVPWEEKARQELCETPERRRKCLVEMRQRVKEIDEFRPYVEDRFLLGFLRIRKFDVDRALKSYKKFFKMRLFNPDKYIPIGQGTLELRERFELGVGAMLRKRNPIDNTGIFILRVGDWTPETGYDLSDIFSPCALGLLFYALDDTSQVYGVRFILDLRGLHMGHLKCFPLSAIRALLHLVQDAFPLRFKGFHVLQNHTFIDYLYFMAKPFLSRKMQKRIHMLGSDVTKLHEHICPSILPEEYGGQDGPFDWRPFVEPLYEIHDWAVQFSYFGYGCE